MVDIKPTPLSFSVHSSLSFIEPQCTRNVGIKTISFTMFIMTPVPGLTGFRMQSTNSSVTASGFPYASVKGRIDHARQIMGCQLAENTSVHNVVDDVDRVICVIICTTSITCDIVGFCAILNPLTTH